MQAEGYGCLLGCLGLRLIAGTIATVGPATGGRGAGSGPELPRVDRQQRRLRGRGSVGPDLSLARLMGGRLALLIASSARLRRPGVHRVGRSLATTIPSRTGPAGWSCWAADGLARARGSSGPGRLSHCNGPRTSRGRRLGSRRCSRGRCLLDGGARLGPGRGPRPGGRTRAWLAGPGSKPGPGHRPPGLDDHVPGRTRVASDRLV